MSTKVPKKVKTLNKRGGVKSKHQEFAHDVPPSHRLSLADVHRTIDEEGAQPGYDIEDWINDYARCIELDWYEQMDLSNNTD